MDSHRIMSVREAHTAEATLLSMGLALEAVHIMPPDPDNQPGMIGFQYDFKPITDRVREIVRDWGIQHDTSTDTLTLTEWVKGTVENGRFSMSVAETTDAACGTVIRWLEDKVWLSDGVGE